MHSKPQQPASRQPQPISRRRQKRARPTPRWLKTASEEDAIAKRRCLMVLSVLSGALPVTEAIAQADVLWSGDRAARNTLRALKQPLGLELSF